MLEQKPDAGWYADAHSEGGLRWWDGQVWTANVAAPIARSTRGRVHSALLVLLSCAGGIAALALVLLLLFGIALRGPGPLDEGGPLVMLTNHNLADIDGDVMEKALAAEGFVCAGVNDDSLDPVVVDCRRTRPGQKPDWPADEWVVVYRHHKGIDGRVRAELVPALRRTGQPLRFPPYGDGLVNVWATERALPPRPSQEVRVPNGTS